MCIYTWIYTLLPVFLIHCCSGVLISLDIAGKADSLWGLFNICSRPNPTKWCRWGMYILFKSANVDAWEVDRGLRGLMWAELCPLESWIMKNAREKLNITRFMIYVNLTVREHRLKGGLLFFCFIQSAVHIYWLVYNLPVPEGLESLWVWGCWASSVHRKNLTDTQRLADIHTHRHKHTQRDGVWWALRGLIRIGVGDDEAHSWMHCSPKRGGSPLRWWLWSRNWGAGRG